METSHLFDKLSCSTATNEDEHILKEPISLDCGHSICKCCIPNVSPVRIKCNKCGDINERDLKNVKASFLISEMIKNGLSDLYTEIEKQISENVGKLKSLLNTQDETLEINIRYIEEEIEIRIESMKNELDSYMEKFRIKLKNMKIEIQNGKLSQINIPKIDDYEQNLVELRSYLQKYGPIDKERFYGHQDILRNLKKEVKNLEYSFNDLKLDFMPSKRNIEEELIGEIYFKASKPTPKDIKEIIEIREHEAKTMGYNYFDSVVLPNNQLLCSTDDSIVLYDDNLNLIKKSVQFDNKVLNPLGLAYDYANSRVYIADSSHNRIIMTDVDLNFIKSFGSRGNSNDLLHIPSGICIKNGYLYICDCYNRRIQILSSDLQYIDTIELIFKPYTIKALKTTIGICSDDGTYFYDMNTKKIKHRYQGIIGRINEINSYFYVFSHKPKKALYAYDANGILIDEISLSKLSVTYFTSNWDASVNILKNNLLITTYNRSKIIKFQIRI